MKRSRFFKSTRRVGFQIRASYDAARTTDENRKHWANADKLAADAVANPMVRCTLRARSRYEVANNSYARGILLTLANYIVGSGPRLQMQTTRSDLNRAIEEAFTDWMLAINLPRKLHVMRMSQCESGEVFGILATNPQLNSPVQLDLRVVEADQVATPYQLQSQTSLTRRLVDGILFDEWDNPIQYYVLNAHPGGGYAAGYAAGTFPGDYSTIPVKSMIHLYRMDRPGQSRGVPEMTSALPLFALLRRYTLAVIGTAEQSALPSGVIYTDAPGEEQVDPMDTFELERGFWMTMPAGWKIGQVKAEQPTTAYRDFKREVLNEICRCVNMPFNIAAGNSSDYNYASGRLDHQMFYRSIRIDQSRLGHICLNRLFRAWFDEAVLIEGLLPQAARKVDVDLAHQWIWDGLEHVDPLKEAAAQQKRLDGHTTTLANEFARQGLDWEVELRQRAREVTLMRELGLIEAEVQNEDPQEEEESGDEAVRTR